MRIWWHFVVYGTLFAVTLLVNVGMGAVYATGSAGVREALVSIAMLSVPLMFVLGGLWIHAAVARAGKPGEREE